MTTRIQLRLSATLISLIMLFSSSVFATTPIPHDLDKIFPYVISEQRLAQQHSPKLLWYKKIGHGVAAILVFAEQGRVEDVSAADLTKLGLTVEQAYQKAIENLALLVRRQEIVSTLYRRGPAERPYIQFGRHWAAASTVLLPGLRGIIDFSLGTTKLCIVIPNNGTLYAFARLDRPYRDRMRNMIQQNEKGAALPLTDNFFTFDEEGIKPFTEK